MSSALPLPAARPWGRAGGVRCLRSVGAGGQGLGPGTVPLACMPCGGLCAAGVVGGSSRDGRLLTVVRGVLCQALSLSRPLVPGGGQPGPIARVSRARGVWAWGPCT